MFTLLFFSSFLIGITQQPNPPLERYRWKQRVLLVFAPAETAKAFSEQKTIFRQHETGFRERELVVLDLLPGGKNTEALRRQFGVKPQEFTVILIGKDGGEKLRRPAPVAAKELFDLIDSMPMRQRERQ
ncbi:MAG: DUF4174 domain-containing protein [Sphingobacteriaceae bacterium]|nr:DUF4174 domain-containing protein [Cytophagaceae bacterium]